MNKSDLLEFTKIIRGLGVNFGAPVSKELYALWFDAFSADGITIDQIRGAARQILRTRKYSSMPTYAEFIEHIEGTAKDRAGTQADAVLETLKVFGSKEKPKFTDPTTEHLMTHRWPWQDWGPKFLEKDIVWWRKDFVEAYESATRNPPQKMIDQARAGQVLQLIIGNREGSQ
jgi:hypothetical protein